MKTDAKPNATATPGLVHDALFYETDEEFVDALAPFLAEGLAAKEAAVVATTARHIDLLRDSLGAKASSVQFIEDDDWYLTPARTIAGWQRWLDEFSARGAHYTRVIGEVKFGATDERRTTWTRFESALNAAFGSAPAWIVCPYNVNGHPEWVLREAERTHPWLWRSSREPSSRYTPPAKLLGEIAEPMPLVQGEPAIDVPIDGAVGEMRAIVRDVARRVNLSQGRVEELALAASEIMSNALVHGEGERRLLVWAMSGSIVCEVRDAGSGVPDPLAGYRPPPHEAMRGMGLWIAGQLCDALAISSDGRGTAVRFSFGT